MVGGWVTRLIKCACGKQKQIRTWRLGMNVFGKRGVQGRLHELEVVAAPTQTVAVCW